MHAALRLFAQRGMAETSVEDITEAADVGKGTFFNYFPSKEHLLIAFGQYQVRKVEAALSEGRDAKIPDSSSAPPLGAFRFARAGPHAAFDPQHHGRAAHE